MARYGATRPQVKLAARRRSYPLIHMRVFHRLGRVHSMCTQVPLGCGQRLNTAVHRATVSPPRAAQTLCITCGWPVDGVGVQLGCPAVDEGAGRPCEWELLWITRRG